MTTNREQHELAAKAAGLTITWKTGVCKGGPFEAAFIGDRPWRPKEDDGDAFRLEVGLKMLVNVSDFFTDATNGSFVGDVEMHKDDPLAATRRAIFRAAVEIGKAMP